MAKVAFISDIHGNIDALRAVLSHIDDQGIGRIICLGDVASYNADQHACMEQLVDRGIEWIVGNHDLIAAGFLEPLNCNVSAYYAGMRARRYLDARWVTHIRRLAVFVRDQDFVAFHASPHAVDEYLTTDARLQRAAALLSDNGFPPVAFFGHTHCNAVFCVDQGSLTRLHGEELKLEPSGLHLVNVGSAGEPRDGDLRATYAEFDSATRVVRFHRIRYDYDTGRQKSLRDGWCMPPRRYSRFVAHARRFALRVRHKLMPRPRDNSSLVAICSRMGLPYPFA